MRPGRQSRLSVVSVSSRPHSVGADLAGREFIGLGPPVRIGLFGQSPERLGGPGRGRALGVGEVKFTGQVTPDIRKVVYKIDLKRVINRRLVMGIADGVLEADGVPIYTATDMRVGLFGATEPVGG